MTTQRSTVKKRRLLLSIKLEQRFKLVNVLNFTQSSERYYSIFVLMKKTVMHFYIISHLIMFGEKFGGFHTL